MLLLFRNLKRFLIPLRILEKERLVDTENKDGAGSVGDCGELKPARVCTARFSYLENDKLLRRLGLFLVCEGVKSPKEDLDVKPVEMLPCEPVDVVRA